MAEATATDGGTRGARCPAAHTSRVAAAASERSTAGLHPAKPETREERRGERERERAQRVLRFFIRRKGNVLCKTKGKKGYFI
uniref:Uncharacterized protein n=1 Tax=Oryza glumipatula TaxID=40148 RepID=A0A0E0A121_9ORYZ